MAIPDQFANANNLTDQGRKLQAVTNSDTVDIASGVPKALLILTAGNIAILPVDGNFSAGAAGTDQGTSTVVAVTAGQVFYAVRVKRVFVTGTTATFLAIY